MLTKKFVAINSASISNQITGSVFRVENFDKISAQFFVYGTQSLGTASLQCTNDDILPPNAYLSPPNAFNSDFAQVPSGSWTTIAGSSYIVIGATPVYVNTVFYNIADVAFRYVRPMWQPSSVVGTPGSSGSMTCILNGKGWA